MSVVRFAEVVRGAPRRTRWSRGDEVGVFAVAFAVRLCVVLTSGGLQGNYGYDASVYYAAADGLVHGRLPYRDFVLLHPPGIVLALAPFAWIGRLTTDHSGFIVANLGFTALGAINAVLVVRLAKRLGLGRWAALIGGCFYALWFGSVQAEYLARLEPLGNLFVLCGLLAYFASQRSGHRYASIACGLALGAAASVKIWYAVPLVVVLGWHLVERRPKRDALLAAGGAVAALVVINAAFFISAPGAMWRMVISEQVGRPQDANSTMTRLSDLTGVSRLLPHLQHPALWGLLAVIAAVFGCASALAWTVTKARLPVALAAVQLAVLLVAPSWFGFYADYLAPALALTIASAAGALAARDVARAANRWLRVARLAWLPVAAASAATMLIFTAGLSHAVAPFPGTVLAADVAHVRCVASDSPMALIELDALSRDYQDGCRVWVDVTGQTYAPHFAAFNAHGSPLPRRANPRWQNDLRSYLMSGNAIVIIRPAGTGLSTTTTAAIEKGGILATDDGVVVYRTPVLSSQTRHAPEPTTAHAPARERDHDDPDGHGADHDHDPD